MDKKTIKITLPFIKVTLALQEFSYSINQVENNFRQFVKAWRDLDLSTKRFYFIRLP